MHPLLLVGAGGAIGAMARYVISAGAARLPTAFPIGTVLINVSGSVAMGLLIGLLARYAPSWQNEARLFLAVGVLGGFTTFSAFSLDTVALIERGALSQALFYVLSSVALSIAGLYFGLLITRGLPA